AEQPVSSNFRLIAATNRPMSEVRKRLDADFLDRIGQFTLHLPPLREIPEDLPWLWQTVLQEALQRAEAAEVFHPLGATHNAEVIRRLSQNGLPGNIRDLFKVANQLIAARIVVDADTPPVPPDESIELAFRALDAELVTIQGDLSRGL